MSLYIPQHLEARTKEKTAFITGRTELDPGQERGTVSRLDGIVRSLCFDGVCFFLVGGEPGFDMIAAEYLIRFRDNPPGRMIKIYSVLPCRDWNVGWPDCLKKRQERILKKSDRVVCASKAYPGAREKRDGIMIGSAAHCVSFCNCRSGRTAETVKRAIRSGVQIHNASSWDVRQLGCGRVMQEWQIWDEKGKFNNSATVSDGSDR